MEVDYRVELDTYSGPLDLLLLLVQRHEIDLNDIPVAELTDQYLRHLELLKQIDVNVVGEFLVMAATLLEIKSAMLMPRPEPGEGETETPSEQLDPRYELVQQLLTYKRFKDAALQLDDRRLIWQARYPLRTVHPSARPEGEPSDAERIEIDLEDAHVLDLCQAFSHILESIGQGPVEHEIVDDDTPIALHAEDILDRLQRDGPITLQQIFVGRQSRIEMIGLFLATLELVRQRRVRVTQDRLEGTISLEQITATQLADFASQDDVESDWRDPKTGQIQYEWPSEEVRQRAEARAKRRLERAKKHQFDASGQEEDIIVVDDDE